MSLSDTQKQTQLKLIDEFKHTKDIVGHDPYELRTTSGKEDDFSGVSFPDLIKDHAVTHVEILNTDHKENALPKIINTVWIGGPLTNELRKETLLGWKKNNPTYDVVLHTDLTNFDSGEGLVLKNWCQQNNIHLVNPEKFFVDHKAYPYYKNEKVRRNFACACDFLRWMILEKWNGIYTDLDVVCNGPLADIHSNDEFWLNADERKMTHASHPLEKKLGREQFLAGLNNDFIFSFRSGELTAKLIDKMTENYVQTFDAILSKQGKRERLDIDYFLNTEKHFKLKDTVFRTGPHNIHVFLKENNINIEDITIPMNDKDIIFGNENSWLHYTNNPMFNEVELKRATTCVIDDLHRRGNTRLLLEEISSKLTSEGLIIVLEILKEKMPKLLENVNTIYLPNRDWFKTNSSFINYMIEENILFTPKHIEQALLGGFALENTLKDYVANRCDVSFQLKLLKLSLDSEDKVKFLINNINDKQAIHKALIDVMNNVNSEYMLDEDVPQNAIIINTIFTLLSKDGTLNHTNELLKPNEILKSFKVILSDYFLNEKMQECTPALFNVLMNQLDDKDKEDFFDSVINWNPHFDIFKFHQLMKDCNYDMPLANMIDLINKDSRLTKVLDQVNKSDDPSKEILIHKLQNKLELSKVNITSNHIMDDKDEDTRKLLFSKLKDLRTDLSNYIDRVKNYDYFKGEFKFKLFFKDSQAYNRKANYLLAHHLLLKLDAIKTDVNTNTFIEEIQRAFGNVINTRSDLISNDKTIVNHYKNRGINSSELNIIIKNANNLVQSLESLITNKTDNHEHIRRTP